MRRKVIQIADSTQLISLPRKWCIANGIKKGDELEVNAVGKQITVSSQHELVTQPITVDVSELDRTSLVDCIRGLYKKGYDEITLKYGRPTAKHHRLGHDINISSVIHTEATHCPGLEVIEQKDNHCILKVISKADPKELDNILRRTFILLNDTCKDFIKAFEENDISSLESIEEKHDNVTRFINHSLRLINKHHEETKNTLFTYQIISMLDKLIDVIKNAARYARQLKTKPSEDSKKIARAILESYEVYYESYYKFDFKKINKIANLKAQVTQLLKKEIPRVSKEELLVLTELAQSLELHKAISEARMAIEF